MISAIEPIYGTIGQNIRRLRRKQKLSQQDLADLLHLQRFSSIADIEHGRARIQVHTLLIFADLFGVTIQELLTQNEQSHMEEA